MTSEPLSYLSSMSVFKLHSIRSYYVTGHQSTYAIHSISTAAPRHNLCTLTAVLVGKIFTEKRRSNFIQCRPFIHICQEHCVLGDLAIIYDVITGYDPGDPQTAASIGHIPDSYTAFFKTDGLRKQRLGLSTNLLIVDPEDKEVAEMIHAAVETMKKAGAEVVNVNIPGLLE